RYYGTVRLLRHVHVRRAAYGLRGPALIVRPRRAGDLPVLVHVVSQRARVLRLRRTEQPLAISAAAVLPSSYSEWSRHPDLRAFRSSIAPPTGASVYASRNTSRCPLQDSRSGWIRYFLSCRALASPTTCRFTPAHSGLPVIRPVTSSGSCGSDCLSISLIDLAVWNPAGGSPMANRNVDCPITGAGGDRANSSRS